MSAERCEGVVLRRHRFSESSLVVVLFTRSFGRVDLLAKGCRRPRSPMYGHLDLFARVDAVFYPRSRGGLDLLTETVVAEDFRAVRLSPARFAVAALLGEVLLATCMVRDPHPRSYDVLVEGLRGLDGGAAPMTSACGLLLQILADLGFAPRIDACAACGAALEARSGGLLSGVKGGLLCGACAPGAPGCSLSARNVAAMRFLAKAGGSGAVSLPFGEQRSLLEALMDYTEAHMERRLRSRGACFDLFREDVA